MRLHLCDCVKAFQQRRLRQNSRWRGARIALIWGLLCVALVPEASSDFQVQPETSFWSGASGGFDISWTNADLVASKGGTVVFSAQRFAKQGFAHFVKVGKDPKTRKMQNCSYERRFRLVGVVGSLLSFSDQYYASCAKEAHPGGETRFTTINLANPGPLAYSGPDAFGQVDVQRPGKAVRLTDMFSEQEVFGKMKADPKLSRLLTQDGVGGEAPKDLTELLQSLDGKIGERPDCFSVPGDLLTRFALRSIGAQEVTAELGLPGTGPCRDDLTPIELRFPMSGGLRAKLGGAAASKAAFAASGEGQLGKRETVIRLRTVPSKR